MTNATEERARTWAQWLSGQLAERGWAQADLVSHSGNLIKRDRASKWVNGREAPSHRLAVVAANTLGAPVSEALEAAGFGAAAITAQVEAVRPAPLPLHEIDERDLLEELLRRAAARATAREDGDRELTIDDVDHIPTPDLSQYDLAAKRGERLADREPYAE